VSKPKCHGLRNGLPCQATDLCDAHIVPRAFARDVRRDQWIIAIGADERIRKPKAQDGVFDPGILCRDCDHFLGEFDQYGIEFCRDFSARAKRMVNGWEVRNTDTKRLAKFILAVLWRASISSRPEFSVVRLGPYENRARDILFGVRRLSGPAFEVMLHRLESAGVNVEAQFTLPEPLQKHWPVNGYAFMLGGMYILAKVDQRLFPRPWRPYVVTDEPIVRGTYQKFEETGQYRVIAKRILNAHMRGLAGSQWVRP
jgi:hypothetical protein